MTDNVNEERDVQNNEEETVTTDNVETSTEKADTKVSDYGTVDPAEFERTRKALEKANKEAQDRRLKLKEWEELNVDPNKVRELLEKQREAEVKRKEEEGRYRELLEEIETSTQSEIQKAKQEAEEQVSKMKSNLEKYFVDKTVTEALASEGASVKLLGKHIKDQVAVIDVDGDYQTVVVDKNGEPRLKRGGAYMTVDDLIAEMKKDDEFARAFPAPKVSGNGTGDASTSNSGRPNTSGLSKSKMTITERAAFRTKYGVDEYNKIPD